MKKTMWKSIISVIAAGAFLLASVPAIAGEVPLSEEVVENEEEQQKEEPQKNKPHVHTFGAWTVTVRATDYSEGKKVRTCTGCGQKETAFIPRTAARITISRIPTIKRPTSTKKTITVNWSHFKHTSKKRKLVWKKIKAVQVQYAVNRSFRFDVKAKMVGKGRRKAKISGLKMNTWYYVRVRYYDGKGYSKWSKVKRIKTKNYY